MITFLAKRLLGGVVLVLAVGIAAFFLSHLAFQHPALALLGTSASSAQQAALTSQLGLDRPLIVQFWDWFSHAVVGDFGTSWYDKNSVNQALALKLPVTLSVVVAATLLTAVFGVLLGFASGLRPGSALDRVSKAIGVVLYALPGFWVALVLVIWFAVQLRWFPAVGFVEPGQSLLGWLQSITLPAIALAVGGVVSVAEQLRNAIVRVGSADFVRTLRSRGIGGARVNLHILRNAAPSALTVLALQFVGLLGGAVIVETIFALPGIGAATQSASTQNDIPTILGFTVVSVVFVVIVNLLLDVVLGVINPKVRVR